MSKKKILTLALCVAMAAILAVGTLAYFTDTDTATNTFTMGNVDIDLWESEVVKDEDGNYIQTGNKEQVGNNYEDVYPGQVIEKDPTIENTGSYDAYTRLTVEVPQSFVSFMDKYYGDEAKNDGSMDYLETVIAKMFDGYNPDLWDFTNSVSMDGLFGGGTVKALWVFDYNGILPAKSNVKLFTKINMPAKMTNEDVKSYGLSNFSMPINSYATQVKGFAEDEAAFVAAERDAALDAAFGGNTGWVPAK